MERHVLLLEAGCSQHYDTRSRVLSAAFPRREQRLLEEGTEYALLLLHVPCTYGMKTDITVQITKGNMLNYTWVVWEPLLNIM